MYYCTVSTSVNPDKVYLEIAEGDLKRGYYSHVKSFLNKWHINDTSFSKYTWEIKAKHQQNMSLKIHLSYSKITKDCLLCLLKKIEIVNYPHPEELLSKRSELVSKCWHSNKYLSIYYITTKQTINYFIIPAEYTQFYVSIKDYLPDACRTWNF